MNFQNSRKAAPKSAHFPTNLTLKEMILKKKPTECVLCVLKEELIGRDKIKLWYTMEAQISDQPSFNF